MKKTFFILILSLLSIPKTNAQPFVIEDPAKYRDSLRQKLITAREDSNKVHLIERIGGSYVFLNSDSATFYFKDANLLAQKINFKIGEVYTFGGLAFSLSLSGNFCHRIRFWNERTFIGSNNERFIADCILMQYTDEFLRGAG